MPKPAAEAQDGAPTVVSLFERRSAGHALLFAQLRPQGRAEMRPLPAFFAAGVLGAGRSLKFGCLFEDAFLLVALNLFAFSSPCFPGYCATRYARPGAPDVWEIRWPHGKISGELL